MSIKYKRAGSGNWNDDTQWSLSSGGPNDTTKPTAADEVILDANSGDLTIAANAVCRSLDCNRSSAYAGVLTHNGGINLDIGDSTATSNSIILRMSPSMTYTKSFNSTIRIVTTSSTQQTIITAGIQLGTFQVNDGNAIFGDDFNGRFFTHGKGTFHTGGYNMTVDTFSVSALGTKSLSLGASTIYLQATTGSVWNCAPGVTSFTFDAGTSNIVINSTSASSRNINGSGQVYNKLTYTIPGSTGALTINGNNTFTELAFSDTSNARTLTLPAGGTQTITTFNVQGTAGKLMTVQSSSAGSPATISKPSGIVSCDYLSLKDSTATGGATFYAGSNSTNISGNTGWLFNSYFSQIFTESIALSETLTKQITRTIGESVSLVETLTKAIVRGAFVESVTLVETLQRETGKLYIETISLGETLRRDLTKTITESVSFAETLHKAISKTFYGQSVQNYLLLEQGGYLLTEDGGKIIIEGGPVVYRETVTKQTSKSFAAAITLVEVFVIPLVRKFRKVKTFLNQAQRITTLRQTRKNTTNLK